MFHKDYRHANHVNLLIKTVNLHQPPPNNCNHTQILLNASQVTVPKTKQKQQQWALFSQDSGTGQAFNPLIGCVIQINCVSFDEINCKCLDVALIHQNIVRTFNGQTNLI